MSDAFEEWWDAPGPYLTEKEFVLGAYKVGRRQAFKEVAEYLRSVAENSGRKLAYARDVLNEQAVTFENLAAGKE